MKAIQKRRKKAKPPKQQQKPGKAKSLVFVINALKYIYLQPSPFYLTTDFLNFMSDLKLIKVPADH